MKKNDVFKFRYSPRQEQGFDSRNHCFEGYLVAREGRAGNLVLVDTYWGIGGDGRVLNEEQIEDEVRKGGSFRFYFNLDDVEKIPNYQQQYFSDDDLFYLSEQHACMESCRFVFKRKGAERSKIKMVICLENELREVQHDIDRATRKASDLIEKIARVKNGDLNINF